MDNFDYYNFHIKSVTSKINKEIAFYENCGYNNIPPLKEYLEYLKSRIGLDRQTKNPNARIVNTGMYTIRKMDLNEYVKDMDILTFRKPWNKLREFHKLMKINEYVDHLHYDDKIGKKKVEKNKKYLKKYLCSGIRDKKFGKNKCEIVYDEKAMTIVSISCLIYDKKTGLYMIDWNS
jgi:hypothetical protein